MRVLMKVQIPTAAGNAAIKDGSLPQIMGKALDALKAEAAYFTSEDGMRTGLIFFEMVDSSDIPPAAEPIPPPPAHPPGYSEGLERPDIRWPFRRTAGRCGTRRRPLSWGR